MREKSDVELLSEYAERGDESSFREIVTRHTDLVFSAALRSVNSPDLAGDVAQNVFCDLAQKAKLLVTKFPANGSLVGWLYRSTRFATLNQLRENRRRADHERQAMERVILDSDPQVEWERIRPLLDEAMDALNEQDRDALLVRYFKNQDFRAVGAALGISDDTAQKRVTRAVDRLRKLLAKRGVKIGAGGLAIIISANAVQSAPLSLAANISAAAVLGGASVSTSTLLTATKAIAMTTLQKTAITFIVVASLGAGVYESHQAANFSEQINTLQQEQAPLIARLRQLNQEHNAASSQLVSLAEENTRLKSGGSNTELLRLRGEVSRLRTTVQDSAHAKTSMDANDPSVKAFLDMRERGAKISGYFQQMPDKAIPELKLAKTEDWVAVARNAKFDSDADIRKTLADAREHGKERLPIGSSLYAYTAANDGQLPTDLSQLEPYIKDALDKKTMPGETPVDDATINSILSRYTLLHTGKLSDYPDKTTFGVETSPVDKQYDSRMKFGNGWGGTVKTGLGEAGDTDDPNY